MDAIELLSAREQHLLRRSCGIAVTFRVDELRKPVSRGVLARGETERVPEVIMKGWEGEVNIWYQVLYQVL